MAKRRFSAQQPRVLHDLQMVRTKMGVTGLKVSQDMDTHGAEIIFDREGHRYTFRCHKYENSLDNLRAAQLAITYLWRALEEYGVTSDTEQLSQIAFDRFFLGFQAPPDDTALLLGDGKKWWEILGLQEDADRGSIVNAYRSLVMMHHPDRGGTVEDFRRVRRAYEEALACREA